MANLVNATSVPAGASACAGVQYGSMMGQPMLVATTGIGPTAAALCVADLVARCGAHITEIVYSGTSGWTPQRGGVINAPECDKPNPSTAINRCVCVCVCVHLASTERAGKDQQRCR